MTRVHRNKIMMIACIAGLILFTPRVCAQTAAASAAEASQTRQTFVDYGKKYIGCPYVSGATGPNAFDCSGFVYSVARESIGYQLPRQVKNIYKFCKIIDDSKREPGDLVFFKTTASEEASHIGIYIGNNQFLNCASDGPNTGVIVSSLKESYWKGKYYHTGRFLPSSGTQESDLSSDQPSSSSSVKAPSPSQKPSSSWSSTAASSKQGKDGFAERIILDGTTAVDWNFFTPDYLRLTFRGISATVNATYNGDKIKPGIGSIIRWDAGTGVLQLPVLFTLSPTEYFRIFAGPVITIGTPYVPGNSNEEIRSSFFPGLIGVCWNSPSVKAGPTDISFCQDIHYTVFNNTDGSALTGIKNLASGLVFSSGVRVTLPLASLIK